MIRLKVDCIAIFLLVTLIIFHTYIHVLFSLTGKNILELKEVTQGDYVSYFIPTLVYGNSYLCCGWVFCI